LAASGLRVERVDFLHPFPESQRLGPDPPDEVDAGDAGPIGRRLDDLVRRLDRLLNGPRDFVVTASKPAGSPD
jgi:hypothetical protein